MSEMHACANPSCSKLTANPRFCSCSCSAAVTNLSHPKRKPEHHCRSCNAPIRSGKTYCEECSEAFKAEQERIRSNTKSYTTLHGERVDTPLPRVFSSRRIVFDTTFNATSLTSRSMIGELIECLIALCLNAPEYLDARDSRRHVSFLHELNRFETPISLERDAPTTEAAKLPLRSLHRVLEKWVFSYFRNGPSGLLPHYALNTVSFMEAVIEGSYHHEPEPWELKSAFGREIAELGLFVSWALNSKNGSPN